MTAEMFLCAVIIIFVVVFVGALCFESPAKSNENTHHDSSDDIQITDHSCDHDSGCD